ncbi:MAG: putative rane protein [Candidatus Parcubacteria bacterium]|jgi:putative membrane protein|nr:putative rane protein [Candidatus Parcubacteria bacterium]
MSLIHWIVSVAAILIAAYLIPGVTVTLVGALVLAIVLGIINLFVKPVLTLLTLPLTILTLGLFSLVLNALLIMLAASIVPGFDVSGFWAALLFGVVLALVNAVFNRLH